MFTDIQSGHAYTVCERIYDEVAVYYVLTYIRCFHGYTLWSWIYVVVTVVLCVQVYHVCSRINGMFKDIR